MICKYFLPFRRLLFHSVVSFDAQRFKILMCLIYLFLFLLPVLLVSYLLRVLLKTSFSGTSPVAQWLRIRRPVQGTRVRALVREDPTCRGATKPVHHNCWACALEPVSHNYWAHVPQLLKPTRLEPVLHSKRSHRNEKPTHCNKEQPPPVATRESPRAATKTQHSYK